MTPLPHDSARLAWWVTAWLRGHVSPDDLLEGVLAGDAAHDVVPVTGGEVVPLVLALGEWRRAGAVSAGLALPTPGHPAGLGGPSEFNQAALTTGEAVVLEGAGIGLVPHRAGSGVVWQSFPAARRPLADLGEADRGLRLALPQTADALAALEVARWRPEVADELISLQRPPAYDAPPGTHPRAVELAGRADQALAIVDLALEDEGGAVSAHEVLAREAALAPLARAARVALVAACSAEVWPPS